MREKLGLLKTPDEAMRTGRRPEHSVCVDVKAELTFVIRSARVIFIKQKSVRAFSPLLDTGLMVFGLKEQWGLGVVEPREGCKKSFVLCRSLPQNKVLWLSSKVPI